MRLGYPLVETVPGGHSGLALQFDANGRLGLLDLSTSKARPVYADLHIRRVNRGKDPLMRAIGHQTKAVIDCTAGWGRDAAHIAGFGAYVTGIEENPVMFELLQNALTFCPKGPVHRQLVFKQGDSAAVLRDLEESVEVIYLDPMYPPKPNTAAPKKALQLLQQLAPPKQDQARLLELAREKAKHRVVVKRPRYADEIAPRKSGEVVGKLVRFDIYPPK